MNADSRENKILIVDDNAPNRHLLRVILKKEGYETAECTNGQECLDYCREGLPSMILLDVMMPILDGVAVCRALREQYSKSRLPIIMVTTKTTGSDLAMGFDAGANDYVYKPVDRRALLARIGNQQQILRYQRNLKEQKRKTERALRIQNALGDALPQGVAVCDRAGGVLNTNEVLARSCDGKPLETIVDVFHHLYGGILAEKYLNEYDRASQDAGYEVEEEIDIDGEPRRNIIVLTRPIHQVGESELRLWVFQDVSRERELERRMNRQVRMETVGLFASGVAHNFNNLLGGILGASQLLRRMDDGSSRFARCMDIIERAVDSGMALTKRMSMVAKKPAGSEEGEHRDFASLAHHIWESVEQKSEPPVSLKLEGDTELSFALSERDLGGILQNLFQNAVDAYDESGAVHCEVIGGAQGRGTIRIRDTGCGMSGEAQEKIFEPFFSTKNLDHRNQVSVEGKGLGMWSVYNLVHIYGGEILLSSTEKAGTTVELRLPLISETAGSEQTEAAV